MPIREFLPMLCKVVVFLILLLFVVFLSIDGWKNNVWPCFVFLTFELDLTFELIPIGLLCLYLCSI